MHYSVTVAAQSRMLCTRSEVKTRLGISGTSEDDRIDAVILAASEQIRQLLGREPWMQTYSEKRAGQGGHLLLLNHWPLLGDPASVTFGTGSSPSTVTASTYSVSGNSRRDRLYRSSRWSTTEVTPSAPVYGSQLPEYTVTYTAGWVMPGEVSTWAASTAYDADAWVEANATEEPFIFQAGGSGTSDSSEPTWPTVSEGTVTDNDITWTAYDQRLPRPLEEAAIMLASETYTGLAPRGVKKEAFEGRVLEYFDNVSAVSSAARAVVAAYA